MGINQQQAVIITRTLPGAEKTANAIKAKGLLPIILPAADIVPRDNIVNVNGVQALIVTSSNTPRVALFGDELLDLPIYAVGDATRDACIERGFNDVISAGGDASALAVLIADRLKPENGKLLHLRGEDVAGDVGGFLRSCGFIVDSAICYETRLNEEFKNNLVAILNENHGFVTIHSPKGGERFLNIAGETNLSNWVAVCISNAAAIPISNMGWNEIKIAAHPNEESLTGLITP